MLLLMVLATSDSASGVAGPYSQAEPAVAAPPLPILLQVAASSANGEADATGWNGTKERLRSLNKLTQSKIQICMKIF